MFGKMVKFWALMGLFFGSVSFATAQDKACSDTFLKSPIYWDLNRLEATKAKIKTGQFAAKAAYKDLIKSANEAKSTRPFSVANKKRAGASGDIKDYVSLSRYWWPDPKSEDGLPYIRKDGYTNPEINGVNFDRRRSQHMTDAVRDLALAAFFTGDASYAKKAKNFVDIWFLHEDWGMNPNLQHGQSVPGKVSGREYGILDARIYWDVMDSLLLLQSEGMVETEFVDRVRKWFGEYAAWLVSSEFGQKAQTKKNNHGVFYDAQLSHVLMFAGYCDIAKEVIERSRERMKEQIEPSGVMPHETTRTQSLFYHSFNAQAFIRLASYARKLGVDYYDLPQEKSGSIKDTVHLVSSYVGRVEAWPYQEIHKNIELPMWSMLIQARRLDQSDNVHAALTALNETDPENRLHLLFGE